MIELIDVSKKYKKKNYGLSSINVKFESGKIYGLLGRNGAGKSTLMNLIANKIFPTSGSIKINSEVLDQRLDISKKIHLLSEKNYYNADMRVIDHFDYIRNINDSFNYKNSLYLAKRFELDVNSKLKELSTGYLTVFKICVALSMDVEYLLLDEPTKGLDANHRQLFYKLLIKYYQDLLNTIIISSHIIDEITNIIEEVIIIKEGMIITQTDVESLLNNAYVISGNDSLVSDYLKHITPILVDKQKYVTNAYVLHQLTKLEEKGLTIQKITLQDLFIVLTDEGEI